MQFSIYTIYSDTLHLQVSIEHDYVGITNMTEKDQTMKGWTIAKVSGEETLEYKFPAKAVIGPGQTLKVCSHCQRLWDFFTVT